MTDQTTSAQAAIDRIHRIQQYTGSGRFAEDENRATRDPVSRRIIASPDHGSDAELTVEFTTEEVFSAAASVDAGGVPTYVPVDFVTIFRPGSQAQLTIHTPVTDFHIWRFPKEYDAFKAGVDATREGTALKEWPLMTKGHIRDLNYNGIHTVEQVAALSDSTSGALRGFTHLKGKAQAWLAARNGAAEAQLEDERDSKLAALEAQVAQLLQALAVQSDQPEKKLYGAAAKAAAKKKETTPDQ